MTFPNYEAAAEAMWRAHSAPSARWENVPSNFKERLIAKAKVAVDGALNDRTLFEYCRVCNGRGSVSVMNGQGDETEYQCELCHFTTGFIRVWPVTE